MLKLLEKLIACPSITPEDAGCQAILTQELKKINFHCESLPFGPVKNLWARLGSEKPLFVFAGHTDVVPPGPLKEWVHPPFAFTLQKDLVFGRGTADMKGAIAAMVVACREFLEKQKKIKGSLAFLITSDEEGPDNVDGTQKVIDVLNARKEKIDYCIVGEPSGKHTVGDEIKMGRRGSLSGLLKIIGKQGHVAYPQHAKNPLALAIPFLQRLQETNWDQGNSFFPPTSFQFVSLRSDTQALNVIPSHLNINFNFRYSPEITAEKIQAKVIALLQQCTLDYEIKWIHSAIPFLTPPGTLTCLVTKIIEKTQGFTPKLTTDGGTSDARFIAPTGAQVLELGLCRESIHQTNEHTTIKDLETLKTLYREILFSLF